MPAFDNCLPSIMDIARVRSVFNRYRGRPPVRPFAAWRLVTRPLVARSLALAGLLAALGVFGPAAAGSHSWTQEKTSASINYRNREVATRYAPEAPRPILDAAAAAAPKINAVHATRAYQGDVPVQTSLCWDGNTRCVPLTGDSLTTHAFNGLDPRKPMYLVHKVAGKNGPLPVPVFVQGAVIVWFSP